MSKILVALSGGVDSSVAALLLKEAGHDVSTAYIRTWLNEEMPLADCPAQQDIEDSRAVAQHLNLDYEIVNLVNEYRDKVVSYLIEGYRKGLTPNPDIMCNREMKFGIFQDYALKQGFDAIATGHYVRKLKNKDGSYDLLKGKDPNKDQSYFLALLSQAQLAKALFPVGELEKPDVRKIAHENKLPNADKKDSQGICFLGNMNINRFLEHYIDENPGPIINHKNETLGTHQGLHRYTIGQRRGVGVPSNTDNEAYVVTHLDFKKNALHVAFDREDSPGLYACDTEIDSISFINKVIGNPCALFAKARYRDPSQAIEFTPKESLKADVRFKVPQRALAEGQVMALYDNETLLGGGFYSKIYPTNPA